MQNISKNRRRKQGQLIRKLKWDLKCALYRRYCIRYQWRSGRCDGNPRDWRSWRTFASLPILFYTEEEAWDYITNSENLFANTGRKASCSVERIWLKEGVNT